MHTYKRLAQYIKPHAWIIMLSLLFSLTLNLGYLGYVGAIIPVVNNIILGADIVLAKDIAIPAFLSNIVATINSLPRLQLFYFLIGWFFIMGFIRCLSEFFSPFFLNMMSEKLMRDIRSKLYGKLIKFPIDFYSKSSTGKLVSKILYDVTVLKNSISQALMDLIIEPLTFLASILAIIFCKMFFPIPWKLIMIALTLFLVIIYPVMAIGKRLRKISKQSLDKMGDITMILHETFSGIRIVKAFSMEPYEAARFDRHNKQFYKITMKSITRMLILSPLIEIVGIISVVVILYSVRLDLISGVFPFGAFAALITALLSLMKPIKKLSRVYGIHQQTMASATNIFALIDTPITVKEKPGAKTLPLFENEIRYENVRFMYEKDVILNGVNMVIKKAQIVAIVGPSGVGKTTLVNLLPRFYDVTGGRIRIDDSDVRDVTLDSLWSQIGLVTQETILFNDTVKANIAYGRNIDSAMEEAVIKAAEVANAHDFITKMPDGYNTIIGEKGFRLSGGEKQRLAIARAIFKNPPILILDEATSQLDTESERLVQSALDRLMKGRTTLIIAHRLSTIKHADKIVVFNKGSIVEAGTHDELLAKGGLYKRLYDMQVE